MPAVFLCNRKLFVLKNLWNEICVHDIMSVSNEQCHQIKIIWNVLAQMTYYFCLMIVQSTDIEKIFDFRDALRLMI